MMKETRELRVKRAVANYKPVNNLYVVATNKKKGNHDILGLDEQSKQLLHNLKLLKKSSVIDALWL